MRASMQRGRRGEEIAVRVLEERGYVIIARNWRCPAGEIDLVARHGEFWVFVEVKARSSDIYGSPEESINAAKRERLLRLGLTYLAEHQLDDVAWRIDVVAIMLGWHGELRDLVIYEDAVRG